MMRSSVISICNIRPLMALLSLWRRLWKELIIHQTVKWSACRHVKISYRRHLRSVIRNCGCKFLKYCRMGLPCKSYGMAFHLGNSSVVLPYAFYHQQQRFSQLILLHLGLAHKNERWLRRSIDYIDRWILNGGTQMFRVHIAALARHWYKKWIFWEQISYISWRRVIISTCSRHSHICRCGRGKEIMQKEQDGV